METGVRIDGTKTEMKDYIIYRSSSHEVYSRNFYKKIDEPHYSEILLQTEDVFIL